MHGAKRNAIIEVFLVIRIFNFKASFLRPNEQKAIPLIHINIHE